MDTGTVIVGAGPAGLAVAACLRHRRTPFVVLEADPAGVAAAWRGRYRRLHLHTAKEHSGLPHLGFPRAYPRYPSRDQVVGYLENYRRHFGIEPQLGQRVQRLTANDDGRWTTRTTTGDEFRSRHVVVCTGYAGVPHRPRWPGDDAFAGRLMHSCDYDTGARFSGQRVLVVGLGNSGGEIALDLIEHGAKVDLAVRGPVNVVPRDLLGMPIQRSTILLSFLPLGVRDWIGRLVSRLTFGDLPALGLHPRADGPVGQIESQGRIPLIDVGTIKALREGRITLRPNLQSFEPRAVRFVDGAVVPYHAVVLATGYRADVAGLLADPAAAIDDQGLPRAPTIAALPGLHFVGFRVRPTGMLREIAREARQVSRTISRTIARNPREN